MIRYPMQRIALTAGFRRYAPKGKSYMHYGNDITGKQPVSDDVLAAHDAKVLYSWYDSAGGNMIILRGGWNERYDVITRYAHLASRAVAAGEQVVCGQKIGVQGNTGTATTGKHLHFEVWLLPKDVSYNFADREKYAIDPISVAHLTDDQVFVRDSETRNSDAIRWPEPKCELLEPLPEGTVARILSGVEVFFYPSNDTPPIIAGDRGCRHYITHFWPTTEYAATLRAVTPNTVVPGSSIEWAGIQAEWGLLWIPLFAGRSELVYPDGAAPAELDKPDEPEEPETPDEPGTPEDPPAEPDDDIPTDDTPTDPEPEDPLPEQPADPQPAQRSFWQLLIDFLAKLLQLFAGGR